MNHHCPALLTETTSPCFKSTCTNTLSPPLTKVTKAPTTSQLPQRKRGALKPHSTLNDGATEATS